MSFGASTMFSNFVLNKKQRGKLLPKKLTYIRTLDVNSAEMRLLLE